MIDRARLETASYAALRIVAGFMFLFHGVQKLIGWFSTRPQPELWTQSWFGGVIELIGGALIMLGLFTRPAAFIAAGTMAVAYWQFHFGASTDKLLPIQNKGELAALYCFVFLLFAVRGAGSISMDRVLGRS